MNHALRDPEVWGCEAHKFTIGGEKTLAKYEAEHIGFADGAVTDGYNWKDLAGSGVCSGAHCSRRMCPAKKLALYTARAFFEEYAKYEWAKSTLPTVAGYPSWWGGFTTVKQSCGAPANHQAIVLTRGLNQVGISFWNCGTVVCPSGWTKTSHIDGRNHADHIFDNVCLDAAECTGCCTQETRTRQHQAWLMSPLMPSDESCCEDAKCQSGWSQTSKNIERWDDWHGIIPAKNCRCTIECSGCAGTWDLDYYSTYAVSTPSFSFASSDATNNAASKPDAPEQAPLSAARVAAAVGAAAALCAGAALIVRRRRSSVAHPAAAVTGDDVEGAAVAALPSKQLALAQHKSVVPAESVDV